MVIAGCAAQEDPEPEAGGSAGSNSGASTRAGSAATNGGTSAGSGGAQAGGTSAGTASSGTSNGGAAGTSGSDGGSAGMATGGGGAGSGGKAGAGGGGAGGMAGKGGAGGMGGTAGAGGKGGAGGMSGTGGTNPVEPCDNSKKDGSESDVDCGGVCTTKCATGKGCDDLTDCIAKNVCDASKCRADGCNASNCAYTLTRVIIGSTAVKGQVFVSWDNDSLDLRFEILDATPFDDNAAAADNWKDDSVEIYLDLNNSKSTAYDGNNDYQINVPRHAGNAVVGIGPVVDYDVITVTRTTDSQGYTLRVSVPWSTLNNATFPTGKTIGFDVGVNDDSDGGERNGQIMLYGSNMNYLNTSQFGVLNIP